MTSSPTRLVVVGCVVGAFLSAGTAAWAQGRTYEAPFSGQPLQQLLQPSATIFCRGEFADSTGYYPKAGKHSLQSGLEKQPKPASWQISLVGDEEARVLMGQEPTPEQFQVIRRDATSVILVRIGQGLVGATVDVLMIDPQNGSFVSSDSSVGTLWNRTTVWVGRCQ